MARTLAAEGRARPAIFVSQVGTAIGLCILGDSLMYSLLPLEAQALGISLPLVGVLLSVNRLVRLISNSWAGVTFARFGPRFPFWIATGLGLVSTVLYGVGWGFFVFLGARLLWGVAWSGLRQGGYEAVWAGSSSTRGRLTGLLWGLVRLGSASSVLVGGWLYDQYGYEMAVAAIAIGAAPALLVAGLLRWPDHSAEPTSSVDSGPSHNASVLAAWRLAFYEPSLRWLISSGFLGHLFNGIVLSSTSLYLANRLAADGQQVPFGVGMLAGLMLGTRWLSDMLMGPTFGYLSDRYGRTLTAIASVSVLLVALLGVVLLPLSFAILALLIVFICDGGIYVVLGASAADSATKTDHPHTFVGVYTTAGDAGSALGPLIAFSLGSVLGLPVLYAGGGVLLALAIFRYRQVGIFEGLKV